MEGLINKMKNILRNPSIPPQGPVPQTVGKTSSKRHIPGGLLPGHGRMRSGHQSPAGSLTSLYKHPTPAILVFLAVMALGLLFLLPVGPLQAQDDGTISYVENGMGPVATFTGTDPEGKTPVWSLLDDASNTQDITGDGNDDVDDDDIADQDRLSIDESSGVLTFNDPPDYEAPIGGTGTSNTYMVVVQAADGTGDDAKMAWKKVEVTVTNEEEDATTGIEMSSLQPQVSTPITVAYVDGVGNPFVDADGAVNTAIVDPDKDDADTDTTIDADDVEWQWSRSSRRTGTYSDIAGDPAKTVPYTPDSADANMYLRVTGTYEDGEGEGKTVMATSAYAVRAFRSDNSAPAFPEDFDSTETGDQLPMADVNDGAMEGDEVGDTVDANDANNDRLTYSLEADSGADADHADVFQINRMTGQVTVGLGKTVSPESDSEETVARVPGIQLAPSGNEFTVTIKATDPSGLSDTVVMTITADETDEAPVFTMDKLSHMHEEKTAATTAVYDFEAYDPEGDDVTYSVSGTDAGKFSISATGALTFDATPDFEMPGDAGGNNVYNVMVKAASTGSGQDATEKSTTLNVMVTVTNEDDDGMVDHSATQPRIGVEISAINLMDPDGTMSGTTWQWERDDAGTIDSPTGDCSADNLAWEDAEGMGADMATYTPEKDDEGKCLRVTATYTDAQGAGKTSEKVSGQPVQKVRNLAPVFTDEDAETAGIQIKPREVDENTTAAAADPNVGAVVAATDDADADDDDGDDITYRLSGADAASFTVDRTDDNTGAQIKVGANAMLDYEATKNTYMVTLTATDPEGLNSSVDVTIKVTAVDEAPEIIVGGLAIAGATRVSHPEDGMTTVGSYTAAGPDAASARWTLEGDDRGDFMVQPSSGMSVMLKFASQPDYENPADADMDNMYMVTIMADDGTYTDTHDVTVTVTYVDDVVEPDPADPLLAEYDPDSDGTIEKADMRKAVRLFFADQLSRSDMRRLVGIYFR